MIKLRPHHLLCTQGYSGRGYSNEFVVNMNEVVSELREGSSDISIVVSTDDICRACPNMMGVDLCGTNEKVKEFDAKVIKHFSIEEKIYNYGEIIKVIREAITEEIMDDICGKCEWYPVSNCKNSLVLSGGVSNY